MDHPAVTPETDISIGYAVVKAHCDGGWALPGGRRTTSFEVAKNHCLALHTRIDSTGGRPRATRTGAWARRHS